MVWSDQNLANLLVITRIGIVRDCCASLSTNLNLKNCGIGLNQIPYRGMVETLQSPRNKN